MLTFNRWNVAPGTVTAHRKASINESLHSKFGVGDESQAFDFTSHYFHKFLKRLNVLIRKNNLASLPLGKRDVVKDFQLKHVDNLTFKLPAEK